MRSSEASSTVNGSRSSSGDLSSRHSTTSTPEAFAKRAFRRKRRAASHSRLPAIEQRRKPQCFAWPTNSASTLSTVVTWTTPGDSSPERRPTAGILKSLLSGARSPKLIEAGSPNIAPNRKLAPGGISQRKHQGIERGVRLGCPYWVPVVFGLYDTPRTPRTREKALNWPSPYVRCLIPVTLNSLGPLAHVGSSATPGTNVFSVFLEGVQ